MGGQYQEILARGLIFPGIARHDGINFRLFNLNGRSIMIFSYLSWEAMMSGKQLYVFMEENLINFHVHQQGEWMD